MLRETFPQEPQVLVPLLRIDSNSRVPKLLSYQSSLAYYKSVMTFSYTGYTGKRFLDVTGALLGLAFLVPLFPFIAIAVKLETAGAVLVRLPRISGGRLIQVFKFRSMVPEAHALRAELIRFNDRPDGPFFKMKQDPRITRVGRILRKTRLDEFPQLLNVLTGELSLVGPRPHEPEEVANYPKEYRHIISAKAGVTGLSQVSGASSLPFLKELMLDSYYTEHQSFLFDLKIILKTIEIFFTDPTAV